MLVQEQHCGTYPASVSVSCWNLIRTSIYAERLWWCSSLGWWVGDHNELRFFAKHGACCTAPVWSLVRVVVLHRWQRKGERQRHWRIGRYILYS
jgi:hypothetical protein